MTTRALFLTTITLGATLVLASAQTNQSTQALAVASPPPALSSTEQMIKDIKNPVPWMNWGADLRFRNEYFKDLLTLNPRAALAEQDYFRFRGRVWTSITPLEDYSFNARLASEPREWMKPAGYTTFAPQSGLDMTEGVFDNINVKGINIAGLPLTATVGRQDIFMGDGWLVGDGTPYDGSWTYFLDSARLAYELKDQQTTIEAIGIIQDARDSGWMPVLNAEQDRLLTEQNEKGAILQIANTTMKAANLTGYFIYKNDSAACMPEAQALKYHPDNADIYTFGGRVNGLLSEHWKYWAEGAYQFGRKEYPILASPYIPADTYHNMAAYGFNSKLSYMFKDKLHNQLTMSFEFLSGDNPNSGNDEMFDVLWGRWPRWSEIGLYSYAPETRVGQEANLIRFGPTWTVDPIKDLQFSASYYALFAPTDVPTLGATQSLPANNPARLFTDSGNFRGHFASAMLKYRFSQHMTGHLWSEFLFPGDYYVNRDLMCFLRAEVMFTF
jgi:hypothetical protein